MNALKYKAKRRKFRVTLDLDRIGEIAEPTEVRATIRRMLRDIGRMIGSTNGGTLTTPAGRVIGRYKMEE